MLVIINITITSTYQYTILDALKSAMWSSDKTIRTWTLDRPSFVTVVETGETASETPDQPRPGSHFQHKYDKIQAMIARIGCMDELLSGWLVATKYDDTWPQIDRI